MNLRSMTNGVSYARVEDPGGPRSMLSGRRALRHVGHDGESHFGDSEALILQNTGCSELQRPSGTHSTGCIVSSPLLAPSLRRWQAKPSCAPYLNRLSHLSYMNHRPRTRRPGCVIEWPRCSVSSIGWIRATRDGAEGSATERLRRKAACNRERTSRERRDATLSHRAQASAIGHRNFPSMLMPPHGAPLWDPVAECVAYGDDTPISVPELVFRPALGPVAQCTFCAVFCRGLAG